MKCYIFIALYFAVPVFIINPSLAVANEFSANIIAIEVSKLYDISNEEAIQRLAREADANDLAAIVSELDIAGYAGAWFDRVDLVLRVGISTPESQGLLKNLGIDPVLVRWSLAELHDAYHRLSVLHKSRSGVGENLRRIAINQERNLVEIGVTPGTEDKATPVL